MEQEADEILWIQCLQGDKNAFKGLYKRFYVLLLNYGSKLTSDRELVEDTIQNLFVKLIQNHKQLSPTRYVKGYMLLSFRNKLYDTLKYQMKSTGIEQFEESFLIEPLASDLFPEEDEEEINTRKLLQVYHALSSRQQEIIYLYYVCNLKHEAIAETLHINAQSSKNLLFRSISKLRELFFSLSFPR